MSLMVLVVLVVADRLYKQSDSNSHTQARPEPTHDLVGNQLNCVISTSSLLK